MANSRGTMPRESMVSLVASAGHGQHVQAFALASRMRRPRPVSAMSASPCWCDGSQSSGPSSAAPRRGRWDRTARSDPPAPSPSGGSIVTTVAFVAQVAAVPGCKCRYRLPCTALERGRSPSVLPTAKRSGQVFVGLGLGLRSGAPKNSGVILMSAAVRSCRP